MKNINKIRLFLLFSATLAVALSCAKNNDRDNSDKTDDKRQVMSGQNDVEKDENTEFTPEYTHIMRLEDNTITLYEVVDGNEVALSSVNIDTSYYPPEDIKELNKGVVAYSKEEGFLRLENFTN